MVATEKSSRRAKRIDLLSTYRQGVAIGLLPRLVHSEESRDFRISDLLQACNSRTGANIMTWSLVRERISRGPLVMLYECRAVQKSLELMERGRGQQGKTHRRGGLMSRALCRPGADLAGKARGGGHNCRAAFSTSNIF